MKKSLFYLALGCLALVLTSLIIPSENSGPCPEAVVVSLDKMQVVVLG
jgi:hypothetical protein